MLKPTAKKRGKGPAFARFALACLAAIALSAGVFALAASPARALSEIKRENMPGSTEPSPPDSPDTPIDKQTLPPVGTVPTPGTTTTPPAAEQPADPSDEDEVEPGDE